MDRLSKIKEVAATYGEENIMGFIIDSAGQCLMTRNRVFSLKEHINEKTMTIQLVEYDAKGRPYMSHTPIALVHSIYVKKKGLQSAQYDLFSMYG